MANIKSSAKRIKVSSTKRMRNKMAMSSLRTTLKKFDVALEAGETTGINQAHNDAVVAVDKAVKKGLLHKNTAARRKSRMSKRLAV